MKNYLGYSQEELKKFYNNGEVYVIRYDRIDKLYMDSNGEIKAKKIYHWNKNGSVGLSKYGRHHIWNEKDTKYFIDFCENDKGNNGKLIKVAD